MNKAGIVELKLYDITGGLIQEIVNEYKTTGEYSLEFNASNPSSGTYILVGKLGDVLRANKLTLIK